MSFLTMLRAGSLLRILALGAAVTSLAACGDDTETTATPSAPTPAAGTPAPATPAPATPAATPAVATIGDAAALIGDWAPDAATCIAGRLMTVGEATITGLALGAAQCEIENGARTGDGVTLVATCSSPEAAFRSVTMTLTARIAGDGPPATMVVLQSGQGLAAGADQPITLIRCAAATP